ncbi:DUF2867 domain-containing protein [Yoonia sp. SS1-5]|uniref:DUF2867 domain-containing protein n=1 Tax=Yoonia rhodophyticola TaxID=3137370 RepID=A0AAN0M892_9RHOB
MPADVRKIDLPAVSALHQQRKAGDFLDCYSVASDLPPRRAAEIVTSFPGWAQALLGIRRIVTAPFGLDNDGPQTADKLGPFPVQSETETEILAGFDDKHLNFLVSVLSHQGQISLATWVAPHHLGGRLYLAAIMPFHIAIARNALVRVAAASQT